MRQFEAQPYRPAHPRLRASQVSKIFITHMHGESIPLAVCSDSTRITCEKFVPITVGGPVYQTSEHTLVCYAHLPILLARCVLPSP